MDAIKYSISRCILEEYQNIGTRDAESGNYSGLIGGLYKNQIKFIACPVYYPFHDETGLIEMSPPFLEDTMTMASMYNVTTGHRDVDMSYMYQSIPSIFWIGIILSLIFLSIIFGVGLNFMDGVQTPIRRQLFKNMRMKVKMKVKKSKSGRAAWIMLSAFLSQPNFPARGTLFMLFMLLASAFPIFFIMCFINNTVGTDLVIVDKPLTLSSYQDVLDKVGVRTLLTDKFAEFEKFASAPKDSIQSKLYQRHDLYDPTPSLMMAATNKVMKQDAVLLGRGFTIDTFSLASLQLMKHVENLRALKVVDTNAKKFTNVFIQRFDVPPIVGKSMKKGVKCLVESGLVNYIYDLGPSFVVHDYFGSVSMSAYEKISSKVEQQKLEPTAIKLSNIHNMINFYLILIVINIICFLSEICYQHINEATDKIKKRKEMDARFVWRLIK